MASDIDRALTRFDKSHLAFVVSQAILKVLPHAKPLYEAKTLDAMAQFVTPGATDKILSNANELSATASSKTMLRLFTGMDAGDSIFAIGTNLGSAVATWFFRRKPKGDQSSIWDDRQEADATVKALLLTHMIRKHLGDNFDEGLKNLLSVRSGRALLAIFASVEVALPFVDRSLHQEQPNILANIVEKHITKQSGKLRVIIGKQDVDDAVKDLPRLVVLIDNLTIASTQNLAPLVNVVAEKLPKSLNITNAIGDVTAIGADILPLYRVLGTHLIAELACSNAAKLAGIDLESIELLEWTNKFLPKLIDPPDSEQIGNTNQQEITALSEDKETPVQKPLTTEIPIETPIPTEHEPVLADLPEKKVDFEAMWAKPKSSWKDNRTIMPDETPIIPEAPAPKDDEFKKLFETVRPSNRPLPPEIPAPLPPPKQPPPPPPPRTAGVPVSPNLFPPQPPEKEPPTPRRKRRTATIIED